MNDLTTPPSSNGGSGPLNVDGDIDGPHLPGGRVMRGTPARWSASRDWTDRDGQPLPKTMLVFDWREVLRRWKEKRPYYITQQPKLTYVVYLVDLMTGAMFTYAHDTWGASQAYGLLTEQIAVMRMLRGTDVHPIVHLEKRPWKSATFGMQMRPHFQPTGDWRTPGGDTGGSVPLPPQSPPPQLGGPSSVTPASTPTTPATPSSTPSAPTAPPPAAAASTQPSSTILDHMKPVKPVTVGEFVADELPWK